MATPILQFSNNAQTTLAGSLTSSATTAQLATGTGATFPALATGQGFYGSLFDALTGKITEIVLVTAIATDNITIVRGQDNTTARAWAAGDTFALYPVAADWNAMAQQAALAGAGYGYAADSGTSNAYVAAFPVAVAALANNVTRQFLVKTTNTGASTLAIDGLAASPIIGLAGTALTGGELVANGIASVTYSVPAASWVLSECTPASGTVAAPTQVAPAVGAKHAVQLQQLQAAQAKTMVLLQTTVVTSAVASIDFTSLSGYNHYVIEVEDLTAVTTGADLRIVQAVGGVFDTGTGAYTYAWAFSNYNGSTTATGQAGATAAYCQLLNGMTVGTGLGVAGCFNLFNALSTTAYKRLTWDFQNANAGTTARYYGGCSHTNLGVINGIRLLLGGSNIATATVKLYGAN